MPLSVGEIFAGQKLVPQNPCAIDREIFIVKFFLSMTYSNEKLCGMKHLPMRAMDKSNFLQQANVFWLYKYLV